ncbi:hypothetical protein Pmani_024853 [Petrolisthes manimaculis]|uniref:Uncharacterized protein n=1 Tax=Petrolisthes manimaculis TaxID=1843537 RepID=A0AAE1U1S5_9EUCA|nr:hypothetical protein Pmani_024853 [Petrolisthes manimaculis]
MISCRSWCGCPAARRAVLFSPQPCRQRGEGSGCERAPSWEARAWHRGPGHTAGAARGRPTCLVSQCWWPTHPQQPPRSVQWPPCPPSDRPSAPTPHLKYQVEAVTRILG